MCVMFGHTRLYSLPRRFDQDAEFRGFAAGYVPTLVRAAYMLLHDIDLAEDMVQATMLRVFKHWGKAREAPEAYSRRVLNNLCRDHWRRQARQPEDHITESEVGSGTVPFTEDVERRDAINQALASLPNLQREVLVLRFFLDLSVEEVADLLAIPEGTAKSATHRGLGRMRGLLTPVSQEASDDERR
jgi:RNA polymerase sigma factor (sigma-70 family)